MVRGDEADLLDAPFDVAFIDADGGGVAGKNRLSELGALAAAVRGGLGVGQDFAAVVEADF